MISKKFVAAGLAFVLTSALIGCNSKDSNTDKKLENTPPKDVANKYQEGNYSLPIVKEPTEITWMGRDSEQAGKSFNTNKAVVFEQAQEKTGIKIKWDVIPNQDYKQTMQMRLASKEKLPDIVLIQGSSDGSDLIKYAEQGVLLPLNDLIDKYAPNLKKMLEQYPDYKKAVTLPNGNIVALGNLNASPYSVSTPLIRKDWLDKLGLGEVKTPEDLMKAAKAFINDDPNGNKQKDEFGVVSNSLGNYMQLGMMFGLSLNSGSGLSVRDGKVTYEWTLPAYKKYLTWMNEAYTAGVLPKDFQTLNGAIQTERLSTNRAGIIAREGIMKFIGLNNPTDSIHQSIPDAVWQPINFENSEAVFPTEVTASIWRSYGITTSAKDPIAAIRLLDYIMAGEGKLDMIYGIEGVTYNMVNGRPVAVPNLEKVIASDKFMGNGNAPEIGSKERSEAAFELEYLSKKLELKKWSEQLVNAIAKKGSTPFQPAIPTSEDAATINKLLTDLNTYRDEMFVKFITGSEKLTNFDKYVEQMNNIGADKLVKIYQKGYDRVNKK